jgi:virginiamycin B lyase
MPKRITAGPDGNVFFVIEGSGDNKQIGKITPDGTVTEYASPNNLSLIGITAGPGGAIWATSTGKVVKMPPSDPSTGTAFNDDQIGSTSEITVGPDGNLWAGDATNGVVKIPPGNPGAGDTDFTGLFGTGKALGLTAGGDGNIWVANNTGDEHSSIVRVSTSGTVVGTPTETGNGLQQSELAAGPPGQVAFTQPIGGAVPERMGRMDFSGHIQFTDMPNGLGDPIGITFGNDGAYWIANFGDNVVRRVTPAGDLTTPIDLGAGSGPRQIAKGPNDTLWVSLETSRKIAKITGVSAPPGGGGNQPPPDKTAPTVSSLKLSDKVFALGSQLATFSRKKTPIGTTISFKVSEQSKTTFAFARKTKGFRSGKRCVAHKPKGHKKAKRCTRFVTTKPTLSFNTAAGSHTLEFEGRLSKRKKLKPGSYRLSVTSVDAAGNKSKAKTASFRLLRK